MGEDQRPEATPSVGAEEALVLETAGGRIRVQWDTDEAATPMGQLAFFAEYLQLGGLFERWSQDCPLTYSSPNAPDKRDVLGTWLLSILSGHCGLVRG